MNNKLSFFVIVGRGRSGTSMLSKILNSNSLFSIPGEFFFIVNLFDKYHKKKIKTKVIKNFVDDIFTEKRFQIKGFDRIKLEEYLIKKSPDNYRDLCLFTYENLSSQKGKENSRLLGDKNPHYAFFIPNIIKIFNDVKFVYIVRDYRDNIISFKNVNFDMNNLYALAYRWNFFNKKIIKYQKLYPDKFLSIKYENIILNSESEIKRVCKFLNIDFEIDMLEFYKNKSNNLSEWHKNLNSNFNSENINKWEKVLTKKQTEKIDYICNNIAVKFGYKEKIKFNLKLFFTTIIYNIYSKAYTQSEMSLFIIPFSLRIKIINLFRKFQKTN
ncbi:MAG: sulfotransferase [Bacteroidales bacterium]|nr:sulfotransferase [Bacteroidales bacterium]